VELAVPLPKLVAAVPAGHQWVAVELAVPLQQLIQPLGAVW
jgi:hypothetical protein